MHDEDDQPKPLSSEPLDVALRLRGYIDGLVDNAERDTEDPPWFISLCSREAKLHIERAQGCHIESSSGEHEQDQQTALSATHREGGAEAGGQTKMVATSPNSEAGGTAGEHVQENITEQLRKKMRLRPHMQRWMIRQAMTHVLRLEYHMRCFILFLTARIIELGRVGEPPEPRQSPQPRGLTYAQRQDQEMRENRRELPRLNGFKVLTPVIESTGKRKRARRSRPYHMLPDDLKVVDAGHVFARLKRLEHVLANADKFAMSLAISAVVAVPALTPEKSDPPPSPSFQGLPTERNRMRNRFPEGELHPDCSTASATAFPPLEKGRWSGAKLLTGGDQSVSSRTDPAALSATHRESAEWREAGVQTKRAHPLYFAPLANFCPPAEHYDSAPDYDQKRDFNLIHWLASSGLEKIGLGVRLDPYRGLPDLSCLDPPDPPRISSL